MRLAISASGALVAHAQTRHLDLGTDDDSPDLVILTL
jgi:hypothetical protein